MTKHTKISVEIETRDLVRQVATSQHRKMGEQIKHWAKKEALRLKIGTRIVPKPHVPKQPDFKDGKNININRVENEKNNRVGN